MRANEGIGALLRDVGLRATRQRQDVLQVLRDNPNTPLSVDELVDELPRGFDRVTAYRIVNTLAEKGLVEKVNHLSNNLKVLLSPSLNKRHEHLITCRICGTSSTAKVCVEPKWQDKLSRLGFSNVSHNLSFTGVCEKHG